MKRIVFFLALLPSFVLGQLHGIEIDSSLPNADVKMQDAYSKTYSLNDLKQENGLLVIFSSNTCPFVKAWEHTYPGLYDLAMKNKVGMALINSNQAYRGTTASQAEMKKIVEEFNYEMIPYLIDVNSDLANAFDANTTPHIFLFNGDGKLVYRGSIDDMQENKDKSVTKTYLNDALVSIGQGKAPKVQTTKNFGCSIKRVK